MSDAEKLQCTLIALAVVVVFIAVLFVTTVVIPDRRDRRYFVMKRADEQHALFCQGDLLGVYGNPETVRHMQTITDWKADDE